MNYLKDITSKIIKVQKILILLIIIVFFSSCNNKKNDEKGQFATFADFQSDSAETTNNNVSSQQLEDNKKNNNCKDSDKLDWFAGYLLNPDMDYAHFSVQGYDKTNTILQKEEEYLKYKQVKEYFIDHNGNFDYEYFHRTYLEAKKTFDVFISGEIQDKYMRKYKGTKYNPNAEEVVNPSIEVEVVE